MTPAFRSVATPTNRSFRVCKVYLATLKVATTAIQVPEWETNRMDDLRPLQDQRHRRYCPSCTLYLEVDGCLSWTITACSLLLQESMQWVAPWSFCVTESMVGFSSPPHCCMFCVRRWDALQRVDLSAGEEREGGATHNMLFSSKFVEMNQACFR